MTFILVPNPMPISSAAPIQTVHSAQTKASYIVAVPSFAPAASATDMIVLSGSATKTIRIKRILLHISLTAAALGTILLIKRSTANTNGTSSSDTIVPLDSTNAAATAVIRRYSANPSALGTAVGDVKRINAVFPAPATLISIEGNAAFVWNFSQEGQLQPLMLRGVNESIAISNNGAALGTGYTVRICEIMWTEE